MGLDLVGYLVIGPTNIAHRRDAAIEVINKTKARGVDIESAGLTGDYDTEDDEI